jgi:hypothetical protein
MRHQTGIGEAHRDARVLAHEHQHRLHLLAQIEADDDSATFQKRGKRSAASRPEKMECFRQDGIAGPPGRRMSRRKSSRPAVVRVASAQQSDEKARINEGASGHSRSP